MPKPNHHDRTPALPGFEPIVFIPPVTTRQPDGSIVVRPGRPVVLNGEDEIGTAESADILGCEADWVARLCDRGTLVEGIDWRRIGDRGNYKIKRASILRLANFKTDGAAPLL